MLALRRLEPATHRRGRARRRPRHLRAVPPAGGRVVCLATPEPFNAVGLWYEDFSQTTDDEVQRLLRRGGQSGRVTDAARRHRRRISAAIVREPCGAVSQGDPAQYDALLDGHRRRRFVLLGEATHGTHEFYRERAQITQAADRREGIHRRRRRGRLAGRVSRQPLRPRDGRRRGRGRRARRTSAASRPGCGATPTCSTSSAGCARTTTAQPADRAGRLLRPRSLQPATPRWRRCSPISTRSIPRPPGGRATATPASTSSATTCRSTATPPRSACSPSCEREVVDAARRAAPAARRVREPRRPHRRGRVTSSPSRTRGWSGTPRSTTGRCSGAASPRGTCATGTWPRRSGAAGASSTGRGPARGVVVWAHNSHLGDARATEMGERRRAERRPARARAVRRATPCSSASRPTPAR